MYSFYLFIHFRNATISSEAVRLPKMKTVWMSSAVGVGKGDDSLYVTNALVPSAKDASCATLEGLHSLPSVSVCCGFDKKHCTYFIYPVCMNPRLYYHITTLHNS